MKTNFLWVIWLGITCMVGGCAEPPQLLTVSGTVLIDGEPLSGGTIRFVPESGRPLSSTIMENGSFQLGASSIGDVRGVDGIPPGKYRIAISASKILSEEKESVHWFAPSRYADFRTSGLEADVQAPQENFIVELTWEGSEEERSATDGENSATVGDEGATIATEAEDPAQDAQPEEE